jgi:hypothetical protein
VLFATAAFVGAADGQIVFNNVHWNDTDGNRIEAHAAGMLHSVVDNRWYWYGETFKGEKGGEPDAGVNCYSSDSIAGPWKFEGEVVKQSDINVPGEAGPFIIERPKVIYNRNTTKFVMWFHLDNVNYTFRHAAVMTADAASGPFQWVHAIQPDGIQSLDMSLFEDPLDGQAYFLRSCDNRYLGISRLSADYLNSTGLITTMPPREGMAMLRLPNGTYFLFTSHLTGFPPNPDEVFRTSGTVLDNTTWISLGNPTGNPTSFNTQPTYIVSKKPATGDPYYILMSDNWVHCGHPLRDACYVWLPIRFGVNTVNVSWADSWDMNHPFGP